MVVTSSKKHEEAAYVLCTGTRTEVIIIRDIWVARMYVTTLSTTGNEVVDFAEVITIFHKIPTSPYINLKVTITKIQNTK
jgi:hypothetical protein